MSVKSLRGSAAFVPLLLLSALLLAGGVEAALCPPTGACATVDRIYDKLADVFGNRAQLLTMEFPGRVLDEAVYWYNVTDSTSQYLKPQQVLEAEFRLVDDMFSVAQVVGGPSGRKVSSMYEQALNLLVPHWLSGQLRTDQEKIRKWILSPVDLPEALHAGMELDAEFECTDKLFADVDKANRIYESDGSKVSTLMDLHTLLLLRYEKIKMEWDLCRVERTNQVIDNPQQRDAFFRWISVVGLSAKGKTDAFWQDVIVRGYHHDVMSALGVLDITPPSEALQNSRDLMRNAKMLSIDGSTNIYPVQLQPANWAESLSTDFSPVDLLLDPDALRSRGEQLQDEINRLTYEKSALEGAKTGNVDELEQKVASAQRALSQAQTNMIQQYGSAIATAAKMILDHYVPAGAAIEVATQALKDKGGSSFTGLDDKDIDKLADLWSKSASAQASLTNAIQVLAAAQADLAAAHATDAKQTIMMLESKIERLQRNLKSIMTQNELAGAGGKGDDKTLLPSSSDPGPWTSIIIHSVASETSDESKMTKEASSSSWGLNLIFASGSGSSDSASSSDHHEYTTKNTDISIGFQATKVTIDRGGWFNPGLFASSASMMHATDSKMQISDHTLMENTQNPIPDSVRNAYLPMLFPSYPISFIIARDITMIIKAQQSFTQSDKEYMHKQSSSSGGFLCFSYSTSSSSTSESSFSYSFSSDQSVVIKIPGAQILGWFQEFVPKDEASEYEPMPDKYYPTIPAPRTPDNPLRSPPIKEDPDDDPDC